MAKSRLKLGVVMSYIFLSMLVPQPAQADWSVGIPGVISVGSNGVKVGGDAGGVNIPLPNCGGSLCGALEDLKKQLNGQKEMEDAAADAEKAYVERAAVAQDNKAVQDEIARITEEGKAAEASYEDQRKRYYENASLVSTQAVTFAQQEGDVLALLDQARQQLVLIQSRSRTVQRESVAASEKLKSALSQVSVEDPAIVNRSQVVLRILAQLTPAFADGSAETLAKMKTSIEEFAKIESTYVSNLHRNVTLLDQMASEREGQNIFAFFQDLDNRIATQQQRLTAVQSTTKEIAQKANDLATNL